MTESSAASLLTRPMSTSQPSDYGSASRDRTLEQTHSLDEYHISKTSATQFIFEQDLYTNAFISCLESPIKRSPRQITAALTPVVIMLAVATIQALATYGIKDYVMNELVSSRTKGIQIGEKIFNGTGNFLNIAVASKICGEYEQYEFNPDSHQQIVMPDGSLYTPDSMTIRENKKDLTIDLPMFKNVKIPSLTWDPQQWSSDRSLLDEAIVVTHDGFTSMYSLYFVTLASLWACVIYIELRNLGHLAGFMDHLTFNETTTPIHFERDQESGKFKLVGRLRGLALVVAWSIIVIRLVVALSLFYAGSYLILHTSVKLDLIMNGLALTFILELDNIVYLALVPHSKQQFIQDIGEMYYKPRLHLAEGVLNAMTIIRPIAKLFCAIAFGVWLRQLQLSVYQEYAREMAFFCLFAGPPPAYQNANLVAPVTGFCESLLGVTCAPKFTSSLHGPCVVSDFDAGQPATFAYYLNDHTPGNELFEDMFYENGTTFRPWTEWGLAIPNLSTKRGSQPPLWIPGSLHDDFRKTCLQMYNPLGSIDRRLVDPDTGEVVNGSPFFCDSDTIKIKELFQKSKGEATRALNDKQVVDALHECAQKNKDRVLKFEDTKDAPPLYVPSKGKGKGTGSTDSSSDKGGEGNGKGMGKGGRRRRRRKEKSLVQGKNIGFNLAEDLVSTSATSTRRILHIASQVN